MQSLDLFDNVAHLHFSLWIHADFDFLHRIFGIKSAINLVKVLLVNHNMSKVVLTRVWFDHDLFLYETSNAWWLLSVTLSRVSSYLMVWIRMYIFRVLERWIFWSHMNVHRGRSRLLQIWLLITVLIDIVIVEAACTCSWPHTVLLSVWSSLCRLIGFLSSGKVVISSIGLRSCWV